MARRRIAFVVPRYGQGIVGGAESAFRALAEQLVATDSAEVQVLTTCARDHLTWQNEFPTGQTIINAVPVWRFPVATQLRDVARYNALHGRLMHGDGLSADEQYEWVGHSAHSPELYSYVETHGSTFDWLIFGPYLFGMTCYASAIHPDRSILWPFLHDEIYARLIPTREMYRACRGAMFNSYPESRLAERLYGAHPGGQTVGVIVNAPTAPAAPDGQRFRTRYHIQEPFVLYAGRLERGKSVTLLADYFSEYKRRRGGNAKLVFMGWGPETLPACPDIVTVGLVNEQAKWDAYTAATVLCQPSVNESFSIVMMEAWLSGTTVLAHGDCGVTRYSVVQSNGGLYFRNYAEFEAALDMLMEDPALNRRLAENGKSYVEAEFSAAAVQSRFETALESWSAPR